MSEDITKFFGKVFLQVMKVRASGVARGSLYPSYSGHDHFLLVEDITKSVSILDFSLIFKFLDILWPLGEAYYLETNS